MTLKKISIEISEYLEYIYNILKYFSHQGWLHDKVWIYGDHQQQQWLLF